MRRKLKIQIGKIKQSQVKVSGQIAGPKWLTGSQMRTANDIWVLLWLKQRQSRFTTLMKTRYIHSKERSNPLIILWS